MLDRLTNLFATTHSPTCHKSTTPGTGSSNVKERSRQVRYGSLTFLLHIHIIKVKMIWINFPITNLVHTFTIITYTQNYSVIKLILNLFLWTVNVYSMCYHSATYTVFETVLSLTLEDPVPFLWHSSGSARTLLSVSAAAVTADFRPTSQ